MKKRFLLLFVLIILCSGCSVKYELDIDKNLNFYEDIAIKSDNSNDTAKIKEFNQYIPVSVDIDDFSAYEKKASDIDYYDMKKNDSSIVFHNIFDRDTFVNSTIVNNAYEYISVAEMKDKIVVSTSMDFLLYRTYDNLDDVQVIITSKYKLINTNADKVDKDKYIWNITRDNAVGKNIYLTLDKTVSDSSSVAKKSFFEKYFATFGIILLLLLGGVLVFMFLKKKSEIGNEV